MKKRTADRATAAQTAATAPALPSRTAWRYGLWVAGVALLVRALYLWQSASGPFFGEPLVDAMAYHDLARHLAVDRVYDQHFLWQAPLYPLALAGLYAVVGVSVAAARVAGALLGVITALLTWRLGQRLLGPGCGLAAGLAVALNGVLLFFESELLATGLAALFVVAIVWLAVDLAARPRAKIGLLAGAAGALALLARPELLPPLLAAFVWALWRRGARRTRAGAALAVVLGAAVLLVPFAAVTHHHTGRLGLWPPSGGINFYLGNHPDFPATLTIRPGLPWEALIARPVLESGQDDPWLSSGWFRAQAFAYIRQQPGAWLVDQGQKALHLVTGRELPRNVDPYQQRTWSPVLAALFWKAGPFGFPAGLLVPLAVMGFVIGRRRLPGVVPLFVAVYAATIVAIFVASRYRAPLWPLLSLAAVAGAVEIWRIWRAGPGRRRALVAAGLLGLVLLSTVTGPFAPERVDLTAELWHGVGLNQLRRDELAPAAASFRRALAAREDYPEAWNRLGVVLARQDSFAAAVPCFERAALLAPDYQDARGNLELAVQRAARASYVAAWVHEQAARDAEAIAGYRQALAYVADWPEARARLAWLLATSVQDSLRNGAEALALAQAAVAGHGEDHPWLQEVLAAAERQAAAESRR